MHIRNSAIAAPATRPRALPARSLLVALVVATLAACATGAVVRSERDPGARFDAYRTFGFFAVPGTDRGGYETLVTRTLKASVRREMEARGYRYVAAGSELLVNFNASLADRVAFYQRPVPTMEYYTYRSYGSWPAYTVDVDQYKEGTLNIDVVDAARNQLVWEGVATGRVTETTYEHREAAIDKAVRDIFARYPLPAATRP